jgi:hypothetical protein
VLRYRCTFSVTEINLHGPDVSEKYSQVVQFGKYFGKMISPFDAVFAYSAPDAFPSFLVATPASRCATPRLHSR